MRPIKLEYVPQSRFPHVRVWVLGFRVHHWMTGLAMILHDRQDVRKQTAAAIHYWRSQDEG